MRYWKSGIVLATLVLITYFADAAEEQQTSGSSRMMIIKDGELSVTLGTKPSPAETRVAELRPRVTRADAQTVFSRFGGEGEGAHTHMLRDWQAGETFQFFLRKQPGGAADTTDALYYIYDRAELLVCPRGPPPRAGKQRSVEKDR